MATTIEVGQIESLAAEYNVVKVSAVVQYSTKSTDFNIHLLLYTPYWNWNTKLEYKNGILEYKLEYKNEQVKNNNPSELLKPIHLCYWCISNHV